jgi:hypothetical protein
MDSKKKSDEVWSFGWSIRSKNGMRCGDRDYQTQEEIGSSAGGGS